MEDVPPGDIVGITAFSGSLYAACFFPTLVVGLYWARGTAAGAVVCVLLGSTTVTAWYFAKLAGWTTYHEVYVGLGVTLVVYVLVSVLTSKRNLRARDTSLETGRELPDLLSGPPEPGG